VGDGPAGLRLEGLVREDAVATIVAATTAGGERVALRRLRGELAGDDGARVLFAEEVRRVATLDHPFLLRVRDADPGADLPWMVTDPVDGGTLEEAMARGAWPFARARDLVAAFLDASRLLESRKQFHAAPIPSRIVLVAGAWRLTTFRDVRAEDEAPRSKGRSPADPRWSAPEIEPGHAAVPKARTLVAWSAGALWFGVRTGKAPNEAPRPTPRSATAEGRALARLLDPEPVRRPHGAEACLAVLASVEG
jgi:hypothetical protein